MKIRSVTLPIMISLLIYNSSFGQSSDEETLLIKSSGVKTQSIGNNSYLTFIQKITPQNDKNFYDKLMIPTDVLMDSNGDLHILDSYSLKIRKTDSKGAYLFSYMKKKSGGSRIPTIGNFDITDDDEIIIYDQMEQRFEVFNTDGKRVRRFKTKDFSGRFNINKEKFYVHTKNFTPVIGSEEYYNRKSGSLIEVYINRRKKAELGHKLELGDDSANILINWIDIAFDSNNNVIAAFKYINKVEKYSPEGKLLFIAERPLNFHYTDLSKEYFTDSNRRELHHRIHTMNKVSPSVAVDSKDRIWILTVNTPEKEVLESNEPDNLKTNIYDLDILDENGKLIGKINLNHFASKIRIFNDRLFVVDKYFGRCVYEYKIKLN